MNIIDTHSHILPALDDGAKNMDEAIQLAEMAANLEGINTLIATPHHLTSAYYNPADKIISSVQAVNSCLKERRIDVTVLPGQEVRLTSAFFSEWEKGSILTLNQSKYILVEFSGDASFNEILEWIHELRLLDLIPVIAHPERIHAVIEAPENAVVFVENGAFCQVTAMTIAGRFGRTIQKTAEKLCRQHCVHLLGSDAHDLVKRAFKVKEAQEKMKKWAGDDWAHVVISENPQRLINDEPILKGDIQALPKRRFFIF